MSSPVQAAQTVGRKIAQAPPPSSGFALQKHPKVPFLPHQTGPRCRRLWCAAGATWRTCPLFVLHFKWDLALQASTRGTLGLWDRQLSSSDRESFATACAH